MPVDVVLSCREDDALLLPQLAGWCRESEEGGAGNERVAVNAVVRGVRSCTLLLTPAAAGGAAAARRRNSSCIATLGGRKDERREAPRGRVGVRRRHEAPQARARGAAGLRTSRKAEPAPSETTRLQPSNWSQSHATSAVVGST